MSELLTPADVAAKFGGGKTARWVLESRLRHGWPSVTVDRTIRFTAEQVDEIIRRHTVQPDANVAALEGQTERSKRAS